MTFYSSHRQPAVWWFFFLKLQVHNIIQVYWLDSKMENLWETVSVHLHYMMHIFSSVDSFLLLLPALFVFHIFSQFFFLLIYFASVSSPFPGVRREDRKQKELPGRSPPVHISVGAWLNKRALRERESTRERRRGVASALGSCSSSLFRWLFFRSCVTILMNQFLFLT